MAPLYVNQPGGVIAHFKDGTSGQIQYGHEVPQDKLADYVDPTQWADPQQRIDPLAAQMEQLAHTRTALREGGQVNSGSSPVPGNYSELDEDGAAQLVASLARYPEDQAAIVLHEILHGGGRQKVLDSASRYARISAHAQVQAGLEDLKRQEYGDSQPVIGFPDPDVLAGSEAQTEVYKQRTEAYADQLEGGRKTPPPSGTGDTTIVNDPNAAESSTSDGLTDDERAALAARRSGENPVQEGQAAEWNKDNVTHDQLDAYVAQHDLTDVPDKSASKQERIDAIQKYEGHEKPATPVNG